jgi:hypothetical protein
LLGDLVVALTLDNGAAIGGTWRSNVGVEGTNRATSLAAAKRCVREADEGGLALSLFVRVQGARAEKKKGRVRVFTVEWEKGEGIDK